MRYLTALLLLSLTGCVGETTARYNPETGEFSFRRAMLGGPVDASLKVKKPDGMEIEAHWRSDVETSDAAAVRLGEQAIISKAQDKVPAGVVP